tara:strand:+ start:98 stop:424 length:327 start_codon:yes stop_codon:yes gene_type:complete
MSKILFITIAILTLSAQANNTEREERNRYFIVIKQAGANAMVIDGKTPVEQCLEKIEFMAQLEFDHLEPVNSIERGFTTLRTSDSGLVDMIHTNCIEYVKVNNPVLAI